ncbi:ROK family transcriptional regulator [Streptomyces indicus]|uniref:Sugar kinase of the NBD/HSP70 family, may contain an N-terminal HTH domain n=1 Tax=Streptomyces indicus TaxID=417292 RepID=A0A1G9DTJ3_9ACTN|nr:ROK family transcriptional regulator [Streptomyces indicus]SDK67162.1 Sugar kinase of the NBD/HSP70 family, may contain an N-terminal HTH domain [Streptomyces indicus]
MNTGNAGANLPALRGHNAALVLDLLRTSGEEGISRLEIAERTGLTPQAVSKIVGRLRAEGLAAEAGRRASTGGKPRTVLRLAPGAGLAVGVHLDRDALIAVLMDLAGTVVDERRAPLDLGAGSDAVLGAVAREVAALTAVREQESVRGQGSAPGSVLGVGVALPGPLDHRGGVLHRVTGFPEWDGFPLRDALAERLALPVVVDKDTNAAALGLALARPSGGGSFAYLHLGTGLGAGLVLSGALYRGDRTGAGEFGHQILQLDGPLCSCGNRGCIEALCLAAVADGDLERAARVLGEGAANLVGLLDIDLVLLGGRTVAGASEVFVRGVADVVRGRARPAVEVSVRQAEGGTRLVAEGAAHLVLAPLFGRANVAFPANRN